VDHALRDIVDGGFDIGVRSGDQVAKDIIAVRTGAPRNRTWSKGDCGG
jgi:hypothetical protein